MKNHGDRYKKRTNLWWAAVFVLFLFGCSSAPVIQTQPVSVQAIANGSVANGRDLFMGNVHFQNGGPPCMGCHNVGNNGLLGGGVMGPDLTDVSGAVNQTGLISVLSNFGPKISPVMQPIYTQHPLTVKEQADLISFLNASDKQVEVDKESIVVVLSLAGFVAAVIVLGVVYRGRLRGVRKALVNKAQEELL